jgi:hypothetical protein
VQGAGYSESQVEMNTAALNCSRIGDEHGCSQFEDGDGRVSGNIEAGMVFGWPVVVDAEATADGSTSIEVLLH